MKYNIIKLHIPGLKGRHAHHLRGFMIEKFGQLSDIFSNHSENGYLLRYPQVQYKIINETAIITIFGNLRNNISVEISQINKLHLNDCDFYVKSKNIEVIDYIPLISDSLNVYKTITGWLAFNQGNYKEYQNCTSDKKVNELLNKILIGNILSLYKGIEYTAEKKILASFKIHKINSTKLKNIPMPIFFGEITTNALLPEYWGIGKSSSRGFGTITSI